ncbi:MAG: bifunctional glutamate N-acetyltransferase/amino-acid acetyltransferase ArgJ [Neisseria sp.]|nr:bifunctional glutamate N-acetyltransferase/amino-acid acetyltransferase ArgJ [Neisseria sp.]
MPVNFYEKHPDEILPIEGVELFVGRAGIKTSDRDDVTLFRLAEGSTVGAVFTKNRFCAAPVYLCKEHLSAADGIRALIVNTGNANAGTGADGRRRAFDICRAVAEHCDIAAENVLPFSTGVILESLPSEKIINVLGNLRPAHWTDAARAIMTTDTVPKAASRQAEIGGTPVRISGISKGAGMICPNMATMLGYIATDAAVSAPLLQKLTERSANQSFNCITVDGDTSTNDSFIIVATGRSGMEEISDEADPRFTELQKLLDEVSLELAQAIVRDGEGATKFITIAVENAANREEARQTAYAVAHSPLVKTAFFASDPNLGRLLAAIGYADIADLDTDKVRLWLGGVLVAEHGGRADGYTEEQGQAVMNESEITVRIDLARGTACGKVYTCDLSHNYVSINADYRS